MMRSSIFQNTQHVNDTSTHRLPGTTMDIDKYMTITGKKGAANLLWVVWLICARC